jgi:isoleucyl-tRNA synthetase
MDTKLKTAVNDFDFNTYVRLLTEFCNEDLSAFFFDIRKDCLYCDAATDPKRMAYRTVLDILFHALVRYAAPVLVFTSEEVWQTRFPDADSVHFSEWPELPAPLDAGASAEMVKRWDLLKEVRAVAFAAAERTRADKIIRTTLEARINVILPDAEMHRQILDHFDVHEGLVSEIFISSEVNILRADPFEHLHVEWNLGKTIGASVHKVDYQKCGRCWRHLPEVVDDGALCDRCADVVGG